MKRLFLAITFFILALWYFYILLGSGLVLPGPPKQDYSEIRKRMRYHGVLVAQMDLAGQWYFYRNNKKCKLK